MADVLGLEGKVVIVTGGTKGVGRGIAARFLEAGAEVVVCGRNAPEAPVAAGGKQATFVAADVREVEQIAAVVDAATKKHGRLDVLVNNAGGSPPADAATASPRFSEAIIRLNLIAPLNFAQRANAVMQTQESGGVIINIASVSAVRPSPGTAAYGAAKAGLLSLTQSLAVEWAPKVRVNAITAGMIRTEQSDLHYGDAASLARVSATVPLGRLAEPKDIGDACLFLASPLSSYVSGASLLVHGGGEKPAFLDAAEKRGQTPFSEKKGSDPFFQEDTMATIFSTPKDLAAAVGKQLGHSDWIEITQDRINKFADATGDHQWIHVDVERAKKGPFGAPIAHGYLTLSLVSLFLPQIMEVHGISMGVNYGTDKVRFPSPVPAGSRIRGSGELVKVEEVGGGGIQATVRVTVEIEGKDKPACVVDTISRYYPASR